MRSCIPQVVRYAVSFYAPKRRTQIAEEICGEKPVYLPGDMLTAIRKRNGFGILFLAEFILFGWCMIVCLLLDLFCGDSGLLWKIPGLCACMISFSLCQENGSRTVLKAMFLFCSFCYGNLWALTALFLIVFEHLAVGGDSGRKEGHE